ncbi:MAG: hypothetical protein K8R87_01825 [Verrucomicrobia bacterium]|nr:hypothetical protein [Verrucomicrobiota bacterium]
MQHVISFPANAGHNGNAQLKLAATRPVSQPVFILQQSAPAADTTTVVSLADLFAYLRNHWKMGLLIALPFAALTFYALGMGPKVYEAESRILLRLQDPNVFGFNEMSRASVTELSAPMLVNNHRSELKARRFADYLNDSIPPADRDALIADGIMTKSLYATVKSWFITPPPAAPLSKQELFARKLDLATRVEPLKDSHILRVQVRTGDAELSARIANRYVEDYIRYVTEQELTTTRASSDFLDRKISEIRQRLQKSEQELTAYRQSQGLMQDNEVKDVASDKVRLLTTSIADAMVRLTKAREDLRTIQSAQSAGRDPLDLKLVAENPDVAATRRLLQSKIAERAPLETWAAKNHPRMIAINQEIDTYRETLKRNISSVITMVQTDTATLGKQIEDLERQFDDSRQVVLAEGGKNVQGNLLRDKVATDRELLQKITVRMNQADLTGQFKESGLLRVADVAVAPERPLKPSKPIALLASMFVFGFCFFGVPVSFGFCKQQVFPMLRGIPAKTIAVEGDPNTNSTIATTAERTSVLARLPNVRNATPATLLGEMLRPGSISSNSMRDLVNAVDQRATIRRGPGVILVASAEPGEGKTAVSSALAAGLCSLGRRVFMIECNPESPTFNLLFPHSVAHETKTNDGLESLRYGTSNLYLLPAIDVPRYEQGDLLESYRGWIEKAGPLVDWIILDGSSVMRNFTDIAPLLPLATDVLLVHDESRNAQEKSTAALNLLRPRLAESTFCGVVVNRGA